MKKDRLNVAIVYDRVNKMGGAERVLSALHTIWPEAPLYTAVYNKTSAVWSDVFEVHSSFIQKFPLAKNHHEWFAWLTPMAFESFTFDSYDIVISVTSAEAKDIITKPGTLHVCYCLTPTRYLWSGVSEYAKRSHIGLPSWLARAGIRLLGSILRQWDVIAASRPDAYIAISNRVKERIKKYYKRSVESVIYPPVDVDFFTPATGEKTYEDSYFLIVARLVGYKRVDIIIRACNELQLPLVVIGSGAEKKLLKNLAGNTIRFVDSVSDIELRTWIQNCRAFIFAGDEDFGISVVEAQACGKPVIAYKHSGVSEIVIDGKTGILFNEQNEDSLITALNIFRKQWYDSTLCRSNAVRFSKQHFVHEFKKQVETIYNRYI